MCFIIPPINEILQSLLCDGLAVIIIMYYFYVYSKYVFTSLTDSPLYLVLYTFGTYLYFVFVYRNVFCFVFAVSPTHTAWCFGNNNLFVFPHVTCNVLSVLNKLVYRSIGLTLCNMDQSCVDLNKVHCKPTYIGHHSIHKQN